jgi:hypothetical protein
MDPSDLSSIQMDASERMILNSYGSPSCRTSVSPTRPLGCSPRSLLPAPSGIFSKNTPYRNPSTPCGPGADGGSIGA